MEQFNLTTDSPVVNYIYLSQALDVNALINSPLTKEQIEQGSIRIYLIKSAMGSGKTKIITDLTNKYNVA